MVFRRLCSFSVRVLCFPWTTDSHLSLAWSNFYHEFNQNSFLHCALASTDAINSSILTHCSLTESPFSANLEDIFYVPNALNLFLSLFHPLVSVIMCSNSKKHEKDVITFFLPSVSWNSCSLKSVPESAHVFSLYFLFLYISAVSLHSGAYLQLHFLGEAHHSSRSASP